MWCFHKWNTISVEDKKSPYVRANLTRVEGVSQSFFKDTKIIRQQCKKCGLERLEYVQY